MSITAHIPVATAHTLIQRAGIERDDRGRFLVPEEAQPLIGHDFTWAGDEALTWALTLIAAADDPAMLVWS
jgi:hypothetical protein